MTAARADWGLTDYEAKVFDAIASPSGATRDDIKRALYGSADHVVDPKIHHVFISKMRKKLSAHGIVIDTRSRGARDLRTYILSDDTREALALAA